MAETMSNMDQQYQHDDKIDEDSVAEQINGLIGECGALNEMIPVNKDDRSYFSNIMATPLYNVLGEKASKYINEYVKAIDNYMMVELGENPALHLVNKGQYNHEKTSSIDLESGCEKGNPVPKIDEFGTKIAEILLEDFGKSETDGDSNDITDGRTSAKRERLSSEGAKAIADTVLQQYTISDASGMKQRTEAKAIYTALLDGTMDAPCLTDIPQPDRDTLKGMLQYKSSVKDAMKTILLKYTTLHRYVAQDNDKVAQRDAINTKMVRYVSEANTVENGVIVPSAFTVDTSKVMWDKAVLTEFGHEIPVLNATSEEILTLLDKESTFTERTVAITKIRHQLSDAGLGKINIFNVLSNFASTKHKPTVIAPLLVPVRDTQETDENGNFLTTASGELKEKVIAMSPRKKGAGTAVRGLDIDFLSHFYKILSPASGAHIYIQKSNEYAKMLGSAPYTSLEDYKADLDENAHPRFYILTPKDVAFRKAAQDSLLTSVFSIFGADLHLVEATINHHKCILVLNSEYANALFNI